MPKQKRGFLLFICSLIPGAGEMYLGFFKQGISIMTLSGQSLQLQEDSVQNFWLSFFL